MGQVNGEEGWESSWSGWGWGDDGDTYCSTDTEGTRKDGDSELGPRRKRVMVLVDHSSHSHHALIWALTHVAHDADVLTLLHVLPLSAPDSSCSSSFHDPNLAASLRSLCTARKPQVEVEAIVIQGPKLATVMGQVKKLEVSVLVLPQKRTSLFLNCFCGSGGDGFVEDCIEAAECLTIGVRKQRKGMDGYLITTRNRRNFWQLA